MQKPNPTPDRIPTRSASRPLTRGELARVHGGVIERDDQLLGSSYADWPTTLPRTR